MQISAKMQAAIIEQINAELYSAYLYLSMASYFENENLSGMAAWMQVQSKEEVEHALKFYRYIYNRGGKVNLKAIDAPPTKWQSPLHVFKDAYDHECKVTKLIHTLVEIAKKEKDIATESFLQWYIDEQVEEESSALAIVEKLQMIKKEGLGYLMIDSELGKRKRSE